MSLSVLVRQSQQGSIVLSNEICASVRSVGERVDLCPIYSADKPSQAFHIHPQDKAILYNIAMIEQKAAEMLLPMAPAKRSLREMQLAVEQAAHAQKFVGQIQQYTCGC
jgi:hypothetical protein